MGNLFSGLRVLDLTNVLAGPFCGYQLALLGADVIKVEAPDGGDLARQLGALPDLNRQNMGSSFLAQNAGKRSIVVDLKTADGKAVFLDLVAGADVVLENFRPGVMERLGLGAETLVRHRPGLIYCAISGFGQTGPLRDNPAYDQIVQGLSGVMSLTGDAGTAPLRVGYPVADTLGGLTAAFAIAAALYRRAMTGEGEIIDVSMLESIIATMGWPVSNWLIAGHFPQATGNQNSTAAPSGAFRVRDGLINIAANRQVQFEALARLIGRPDLVADPRFSDREARKVHRMALQVEIEAALASGDGAEWVRRLNRVGVPAGEILSVPQVLEHPQVVERQLVLDLGPVEPLARPLRVVRSGFRLGRGDLPPPALPPHLGQHSAEILGELGYDSARIAELVEAGAVRLSAA